MKHPYAVAAIVIVLLVLVAASHQFMGTTTDDLAANKPSAEKDREKQKTKDAASEKAKGKVPLPKPVGSPDASIKISVYVTSDNGCDTTTLTGIENITKRFGKDVYVKYRDLLDKTVEQEAQTAKISCKSGLTINGKSKFILPDRGLKGTIMLDGPMGEKNYDMKDIEAIVAHLLKRSGKAKAAPAGKAETTGDR